MYDACMGVCVCVHIYICIYLSLIICGLKYSTGTCAHGKLYPTLRWKLTCSVVVIILYDELLQKQGLVLYCVQMWAI